MEDNLQEILGIYRHSIEMLAIHENKYNGKIKGNAYFKQRVALESRINHYKQKISNFGIKINVVKVTYQKVKPTTNPNLEVRGIQVYSMYFSNVSGETAKLLLLQLQPLAVNIETAPLYLGTEFLNH